jgi:hypothetical protein
MSLIDKALLVQLNISQWTARKYDRKATQNVAVNFNTTTSAGRYNKALLPMNDYLDRVHKKTTLIRTKFYTNTSPWGIEGTFMLSSKNYLPFTNEFRKEKGEWQYLVDDFLNNYKDLKDNAKRFLNDLYDETDYPPQDILAKKFSMDLAIFPVPSTDFRVAIGDEELAEIQKDVERRVMDAQNHAMQDLWDRLYKQVEHMTEKLSDPKAIFRDSMVDNARELCSLLPRLNFTDDPNLENLRQQVEANIARHHPDALRNDPDLRQDTAAEAKAIMEKMKTFMGV